MRALTAFMPLSAVYAASTASSGRGPRTVMARLHAPGRSLVTLDLGIDRAVRQQAFDRRGIERAHRDGRRIAQLIEQRRVDVDRRPTRP